MKRSIAGSVIAAAALALTGCQQDSAPTAPQADVGLSAALASAQAGGRVFVVFDGEADPALVEQLGGHVVYSYHLVPAVAVTAPGHVISQLEAHPRVVRVEPDGRVHIIDAELDNTWGVKRIGSGVVHDGGKKGKGVRVAVIDSGCDYTHSDLDGNYKGGFDFVNDDDDPMDDNGHGTHVSGTVAAEDNDVGVVGVAPEAALYCLKVLSASGGGSWSDIIAALQWAVDNGIQVTNNSYGSGTNPGGTVQAAFDNSAAAGILHVAAAGNSGNPRGKGNNVGYPARFESVIAVAATDKNDNRASFSSTGDAVELAAPGVAINSTKLGGGYVEFNGTSMASPHVAGTAALVIAAGIADVRTQLQTTADDLGDSERDPLYGFGLVDADEAAPSGPVAKGSIAGKVTNADGGAEISRATVLVEGTGLLATTDANGDYTIPDVPTGDHTVTASADGFNSASQTVAVSENITTTANFALNPVTTGATVSVAPITYATDGGRDKDKHLLITVALVDDLGDPVGGASVSIDLFRDGSSAGSGTATTGTDGTVTFTVKNANSGCYTTTVTDVTATGLTWDGVTPANKFCK